MANYGGSQLITVNLLAGADLSAAQYKIVKLASTAGEVVLAGDGTGFGVLQNDPPDGQVAEVAILGLSKVVAEASVNANVVITSNSSGQAQATTSANNKVLGKNIDASSAAGDVIRVMLTGFSNY